MSGFCYTAHLIVSAQLMHTPRIKYIYKANTHKTSKLAIQILSHGLSEYLKYMRLFGTHGSCFMFSGYMCLNVKIPDLFWSD